ncbi:MAG: hypothetical protein EHM77_07290, partial [Planctomycetaceae bacterium]
MKSIEALRARLVEIQEVGKACQSTADAEKRDLTLAEQTELDALFAEFESVEKDIERRIKLDAQESRLGESVGRVVPPQPIAAPANVVSQGSSGLRNTRLTTIEDRARWGFRDFGEFCNTVRRAATNPSEPDARLIQNALTTYGSEGVGADGGFAV